MSEQEKLAELQRLAQEFTAKMDAAGAVAILCVCLPEFPGAPGFGLTGARLPSDPATVRVWAMGCAQIIAKTIKGVADLVEHSAPKPGLKS